MKSLYLAQDDNHDTGAVAAVQSKKLRLLSPNEAFYICLAVNGVGRVFIVNRTQTQRPDAECRTGQYR